MTIAYRTTPMVVVLALLLCGGGWVGQAQEVAPASMPESKPSPATAPAAPEQTAPAPASVPKATWTPYLDDMVVTATRGEKTVFDTPYTVESLSADDIQLRLTARSLPDALKETPAVMVQKTAYGQGSPYIRGFTGFRTLMLIDGIRLNNSVFRDGPNQYWSTVDPLSVDRLEVVKGPGSVLYGSDAIGGTVNAITQGRREYGEGFLWD
ncbi:MAG: hypothetical protein FJ388_20385, partial [Verrucomicrobia bacterium]|nr:hypothetical protein [Verrucomicrobiota bacterium]